MDAFQADNRCPKCSGDASAKHHGAGRGCAQFPGVHIHRRCEDCGFSWAEQILGMPSAPLQVDTRHWSTG